MSYRECRNLCQMLRSLNYPRIVSLQNFNKPNFQLVADILYWLAQKYDPAANISDNINEEKDRIQFIKTIVNLFAVKAKIKINPKKIYQADTQAVEEILKLVTVLYKASIAPPIEEQEATALTLPLKVSNLKNHKLLANDICQLGARLYDSIAQQPELKISRNEAISFLESMNNLEDGDQKYIQNSIKQIMQQQNENTTQMTKYVTNMQHERKVLEQKLKKKNMQLQRTQKSYREMIVVKPSFMQEYEKLQLELVHLQEIYVNKYRNLNFLQNELQIYNVKEKEKARKAKLRLQKLQQKIKQTQINNLKGMDQLEEDLGQRTFTRGKSRKDGEHDLIQQESAEDEEDSDDDDADDDDDDDDDDEDDASDF